MSYEEVPLNNYFNELAIIPSPGNDEIRAYRIKKFLRTRLNGTSLAELSKRCNIKYKNIENWLEKGKRDIGIPLTQLKEISAFLGVSRETLFQKVEIFGGTNTKKYKLPKYVDLKLAYLAGYIMGDGHLANPSDSISNGSEYNAEIKITTGERQHIVFLQQIFFELFAYKPPIFEEKNFYKLIARAKIIHRFLDKICKIPTGNKKEKTYVPEIVKANVMLKRYFLSGFFDADGTIVISRGILRGIRIKQYNRGILEECREILIEAGIQSIGIYADYGFRKGKKTKAHVLAIQNQRDIRRFIKMFFSLKIQEKGITLIEEQKIPEHIAFIPDGN